MSENNANSLAVGEFNKRLEKAARDNVFVWTTTNIPLPKNMKWDFRYRKWQIPILNNDKKNIVVMKPAQVGMSTIFAAKLLHFAYYTATRCAYVLPRQKDFEDMVSTRVNPMIDDSPLLSNLLFKPDSLSRKRIGNSFLHFLEANTEPRMLDIDVLIIDEVDLCNQEYLDLYSARLFASMYKIHHSLSTPSVPDYGIHRLLKTSTWNVWNVRCPYCSKWIPFDDNWTSILKETSYRIYYGANCCDKCKDLGLTKEHISDGIWVASYPKNQTVGYQVIRTMDAMTSAEELYRLWKESRVERNFYNSALGLPYSAQSLILSKDDILNLCLDRNVKKITDTKDGKSVYIGVDQGNTLHMAVLKEDDDGNLCLVNANTFPDSSGNPFKKAEKEVKYYNNFALLCDSTPNTHSAREFVSQFRKGKLSSFQSIKGDSVYEESKNSDFLLLLNKHESLDELFDNYIKKGKLRFYTNSDGHVDKIVEEVAEHLAALKRTYQSTNTRNVGEVLRAYWESTAPDHYAMAILYAMVAYMFYKKNGKSRAKWTLL